MSGQGITTTVLKTPMFPSETATFTVSTIHSSSSSLSPIILSSVTVSSSLSPTSLSAVVVVAAKKSNTGPIVGGVVAGVLALMLGAGAAFYFWRRNRMSRNGGRVGTFPAAEAKEPSDEGGTGVGSGNESAAPLPSTWTYSHPSNRELHFVYFSFSFRQIEKATS